MQVLLFWRTTAMFSALGAPQVQQAAVSTMLLLGCGQQCLCSWVSNGACNLCIQDVCMYLNRKFDGMLPRSHNNALEKATPK
jgi:hypothetical protein